MSMLGCVGAIGDAPGHEAGAEGEGEGESGVATSHLRRLTRFEYEQSLRDLVGDDAVNAAAAELGLLPADDVGVAFTTMSVDVQDSHVDAHFQIAQRIGEHFAANPMAAAALTPCLAEAPVAATCADELALTFGRRVFRRPLESGERARLASLITEGEALEAREGVVLVMMHMLLAPAFLYRPELVADAADVTVPLDAFSLATRLSFYVWGRTPDDALLDAAESGSLLDDASYRAELERLLADPRAQTQLSRFTSEWLELDAMAQPHMDADFLDGVDPTGLTEAMRNEIAAFVDYQVLEAQAPLSALFESRESFVSSPALGAIYGVPANGQVTLSAGDRAGLLTRAGLLMGPDRVSEPVHRGSWLRRKVLCEETAPPNPADFPPEELVAPPFDPNKTTRQRWEEKTSAPACQSCHAPINSMGFALESYDALGRFRTLENIYDPTDGALLGTLPVDSQVELVIDGKTVRVAGPVELSAAIGASSQASRCFSEQWLAFAMGREPKPEDDAWLIELRRPLVEESVLTMMRTMALSPQFRNYRR